MTRNVVLWVYRAEVLKIEALCSSETFVSAYRSQRQGFSYCGSWPPQLGSVGQRGTSDEPKEKGVTSVSLIMGCHINLCIIFDVSEVLMLHHRSEDGRGKQVGKFSQFLADYTVQHAIRQSLILGALRTWYLTRILKSVIGPRLGGRRNVRLPEKWWKCQGRAGMNAASLKMILRRRACRQHSYRPEVPKLLEPPPP